MTVWGPWTSNGHVRLGADWSYSGATLNVTISVQTAWSYSGNSCHLNWSGTWAGGPFNFTFSAANPSTQTVWSGAFTQAYNSTATLNLAMTGLYDGSAPTLTINPTLGPLPPAAATGFTSTRVSDAQANLAWTDNPTSTAPIDNIGVWRRDNLTAQAMIAALAGTAASYSDTGLVADRRYEHLIASANSSGATNSAWSASIYTTPAAPSSVSATLTGSDIVVSITPASSYAAECQYVITHGTVSGGVTTWDASPLATTGVGVTTYTDVAPGGATHIYKAAAKAPSTLTGTATVSNSVPLASTPNAPTGQAVTSTRQSGSVIDAAVAATLTWVHNPTDSSAQTQYEVQYRVDGGAWVSSGTVVSTISSRTIAAGTWADEHTVEWQVRTWGVYATASPWSTTATITTAAIPVVSVSSAPTCTTSTMTATGGYTSSGSHAQAAGRWSLRTMTGETLETVTVTGASLSYTFASTVANGVSYVQAFQAQDSLGLWSVESTATVAVSYAPPSTPTLAVTFDPTTGAVVGTITNPAPGTGEVAAVSNAVYRDGLPLQTLANVSANGTFIDRVPPLGATVTYTVEAVSATPSSAMSASVDVSTAATQVWLNGGPAMTVGVAVYLDPILKRKTSLAKVTRLYKGRATPVIYTGIATSADSTLTGVMADVPSLEALEAVVNLPGEACYRDPDGRREWVGLLDISYDVGAGHVGYYPFSITMTRVDYAE